ncbi:MAG: MBL fold metallo-hydrolase [Pseudomonadota bacterium]
MTDTSNSTDQPARALEVSVIPVTDIQQNCSVLTCTATRRSALVDPGGEAERLIDLVQQGGIELEQVLLTHGHIDHIGGAQDIADQFNIPIVGPHSADAPLIDNVEDQARMFGVPGVRAPTIDRWLEAGDTIQVGEVVFEVLHTPGHAPGHVIFVNHESRFIVMGDVLFAGSVGRTDLPLADHGTLMKSIFQTVLTLGDDYQFLPGHGPASSLGRERQTNPFLQDGFSA